MSLNFYEVAANTPFNNSILTYTSEIEFNPGDLVEIPLGKRMTLGCVLGLVDPDSCEGLNLKKIRGVFEDNYNLSEEIEFLRWVSNYYHYPLGQLVGDILPKTLKRPRELKPITSSENIEIQLESSQQKVWEKIDSMKLNSFSKHLIHGVTGSGKSVLYLEKLRAVFKEGKRALFLVPEINLTPQFIEFFKTHLDVPIYLYHSDISNSDKYNLWKLMNSSGEAALIIGVRSSIFVPIKNLGLIVVDEEHDSSFKQDDRCTYNARDIAIKKSQLLNIPIVTGSATPTVESYVNYKKSGSYSELTKRYSKGDLPEITLVDLREADYGADYDIWPIPESTMKKIEQRLENKEQVIVFVNKLGFASYVQCRSCGHTFECPNCSVSLTMFKGRRELSCHSCTYRTDMPDICPECQNMNLLNKGFGTEKVKEVLENRLASYKIGRFDRDEIKTSSKLETVLKDFHDGVTDVLVGTQMISKGHNFKNVNLVVVLGIDSQMNYPDYRASERTYQILTQISGRSGRFGKDSEVLIHTHSPENEIFSFIKNHDFNGFYEKEIIIRKACACPPFFKLAAVYFNGKNRDNLIKDAELITQEMKKLTQEHFRDVMVLGPRPTVIEKRANRFTWVTQLKSSNLNELHNLLGTIERAIKLKSGNSMKIDIDPVFMA